MRNLAEKPTKLSLKQIADRISAKLVGSESQLATGLCGLEDASESKLAFSKETSVDKLNKLFEASKLAALIISAKVNSSELKGNFLLVENPQLALMSLIPDFYDTAPNWTGIHETAVIHPTVKLGQNISIAPYCVISEGAQLGDNVTLHPHVTIYPYAQLGSDSIIHSGASIREYCVIGKNCVVQNGAVIGSDGFGYLPDPKLGLRSVPQVGIVNLSDGVDVGANSCIDRATLGETTIGKGTKLDNHVQIGHNNKIGEFCILCAQTGIAGSSEIGAGAVFGGQSGLADHLKVAAGARVGAASAVLSNLPEKADYLGNPAIKASEFHRMTVLLRRLPELFKKKSLS